MHCYFFELTPVLLLLLLLSTSSFLSLAEFFFRLAGSNLSNSTGYMLVLLVNSRTSELPFSCSTSWGHTLFIINWSLPFHLLPSSESVSPNNNNILTSKARNWELNINCFRMPKKEREGVRIIKLTLYFAACCLVWMKEWVTWEIGDYLNWKDMI